MRAHFDVAESAVVRPRDDERGEGVDLVEPRHGGPGRDHLVVEFVFVSNPNAAAADGHGGLIDRETAARGTPRRGDFVNQSEGLSTILAHDKHDVVARGAQIGQEQVAEFVENGLGISQARRNLISPVRHSPRRPS